MACLLASLRSVLQAQEASVQAFHTTSAVLLYSPRNVLACRSSVFLSGQTRKYFYNNINNNKNAFAFVYTSIFLICHENSLFIHISRISPCSSTRAQSLSIELPLTNVLRVAFRDGWHPVEVRPAQSLVHILFFQPFNDGVKVSHQGAGVHLVGSKGLLEHLRPGLGGARLEDLPGMMENLK